MIPLTACDRFLEGDFAHITLMNNPPGDGNCEFGAPCFWLNRLGIHRSPEKVREEIVEYLENHSTDTEGFPLKLYPFKTICRRALVTVLAVNGNGWYLW